MTPTHKTTFLLPIIFTFFASGCFLLPRNEKVIEAPDLPLGGTGRISLVNDSTLVIWGQGQDKPPVATMVTNTDGEIVVRVLARSYPKGARDIGPAKLSIRGIKSGRITYVLTNKFEWYSLWRADGQVVFFEFLNDSTAGVPNTIGFSDRNLAIRRVILKER